MNYSEAIEIINTTFQHRVENNIEKMISRDNNMVGLGLKNRVLAYAQMEGCTDIKSEACWAELGRVVNEGALPIFILVPMYKKQFTDKSTGSAVSIEGIRPEELQAATTYGILEANEIRHGERIAVTYDVSSTTALDDVDAYEYKKNIKISEIVMAVAEVGALAVAKGTETYICEGTLMVGTENVEEKVRKLCDIAAELASVNNNNEDSIQKNERIMGNYKKYISCVLKSFLGVQSDHGDISIKEWVELCGIENVKNSLETADDTADDIICKIIGNTANKMKSALRRMEIMRKADKLLCAVDSCEVRAVLDNEGGRHNG